MLGIFKNKSLIVEFVLIDGMDKTLANKSNIEIPSKIVVKISDLRGASSKDAILFMEIASMMEVGINTDKFKGIVCDPNLKLELTKGLDNEHIYEAIVSGSTDLEPIEDKEINIHIEIYYSRWSRTIGYTYPNTVWQWFNRKFLSTTKEGKISMANNMLHEYCHKCGFGHQSRGYSRMNVPYFYGDTLEKVLTEK